MVQDTSEAFGWSHSVCKAQALEWTGLLNHLGCHNAAAEVDFLLRGCGRKGHEERRI
jgi:hypothetical protein